MITNDVLAIVFITLAVLLQAASVGFIVGFIWKLFGGWQLVRHAWIDLHHLLARWLGQEIEWLPGVKGYTWRGWTYINRVDDEGGRK